MPWRQFYQGLTMEKRITGNIGIHAISSIGVRSLYALGCMQYTINFTLKCRPRSESDETVTRSDSYAEHSSGAAMLPQGSGSGERLASF